MRCSFRYRKMSTCPTGQKLCILDWEHVIEQVNIARHSSRPRDYPKNKTEVSRLEYLTLITNPPHGKAGHRFEVQASKVVLKRSQNSERLIWLSPLIRSRVLGCKVADRGLGTWGLTSLKEKEHMMSQVRVLLRRRSTGINYPGTDG